MCTRRWPGHLPINTGSRVVYGLCNILVRRGEISFFFFLTKKKGVLRDGTNVVGKDLLALHWVGNLDQ